MKYSSYKGKTFSGGLTPEAVPIDVDASDGEIAESDHESRHKRHAKKKSRHSRRSASRERKIRRDERPSRRDESEDNERASRRDDDERHRVERRDDRARRSPSREPVENTGLCFFIVMKLVAVFFIKAFSGMGKSNSGFSVMGN